METARRLDKYPACDVYTFHGMAGKLFSTLVSNDSILHGIRKSGVTPDWAGEPYELIVLDELQDCTHDLFWLTCAFISSVARSAGGRAPRIVVLGDERQAIYNFRGADPRFLSLSSSILAALSPHPWSHLPLSKSFRLSHQNSAFVNKVFLQGEEYIVGSHNGPKPLYIHGDIFKPRHIAQHLVPLIRKYGAERTAIIAPSVRENWALSELTNSLSRQHGLPIAVSISDEVNLDDDVLAGKICVSTYHQFKGNERDLVIVYGADGGYFAFASDLPDDTCPNATFVALTRACKQLVVLNHNKNPPMPFISLPELHKTATFMDLTDRGLKNLQPVGRPQELGLHLPKNIHVSHLARHVPDELLDEICKTHLEIKQVSPPLPSALHIKAPDKALTNPARRYYEAVSDLNGMAVVAAYEYALLRTLTTLGIQPKTTPLEIPSESYEQAAWLCHKACTYEAGLSGYKSRSIQMDHHAFDWLGPYLDTARRRLTEQFEDADRLQFEVKLERKNLEVAHPSGEESQIIEKLSGRADIVRHDGRPTPAPGKESEEDISIWEIKFVAQLSLEHAIQVCTYAYLWSTKHRTEHLPRIVLFNVRDGEKWEIVARDGVAGLRSLVEDVLRAKYTTKGVPSTDEFLKKCSRTRAEVQAVDRS